MLNASFDRKLREHFLQHECFLSEGTALIQ